MKPFFYQLILPLNSALSELYKSVCAVLPWFGSNFKLAYFFWLLFTEIPATHRTIVDFQCKTILVWQTNLNYPAVNRWLPDMCIASADPGQVSWVTIPICDTVFTAIFVCHVMSCSLYKNGAGEGLRSPDSTLEGLRVANYTTPAYRPTSFLDAFALHIMGCDVKYSIIAHLIIHVS